MPISTPESGQKACTYCNTPAAPLAAQCANCGANLPGALPRPVAQLVAAQARWSMGKTALVCIVTSIALGAGFNASWLGTWVVILLSGFWVAFFMPAMLFVSAFVHSRNDAGRVMLNLIIATTVWVLGILLIFITALIY